jgi:hypothetical protein
MRLRRLGCAGLELEAGGRGLAALVTHLHRDHADVAAIERALTSVAASEGGPDHTLWG